MSFCLFLFFLTLAHWTWNKLNEDVTTCSAKLVTDNELTVRMRHCVYSVSIFDLLLHAKPNSPQRTQNHNLDAQ